MFLSSGVIIGHKISLSQFIQSVPEELLAVTTAYVLFKAGTVVKNEGRVTIPEALQEICPNLSKKFLNKLVRKWISYKKANFS